MKNIFKHFILILICFIPVMVDAKANFEYERNYLNVIYVGSSDGFDYFYNNDKDVYEDGYVLIYDKEGELVKEDKLVENDNFTFSDIVNSNYVKMFPSFYLFDNDVIYNDTIYFDIDYARTQFYYFDPEHGGRVYIKFKDDEEFTRKVLGKKYDIYLWGENNGYYIRKINDLGDYFVVSYEFASTSYLAFLDKNIEEIKVFNNTDKHIYIYVYDNLIYFIEDNIYLKIFNLSWDLVSEFTIENDNVGEGGSCNNFYPTMMNIVDDKLFINFYRYSCPKRLNLQDESLYDTVKDSYLKYFTLVYDINYEIDKVSSNNGDFTYVEKVDEDGKSYVELKIIPKEGYEVDKIIVTDLNGNVIEVKDNKFYMPLNDVKIEVQYKEVVEYVPIPDTFLGKSVSLIIIGFILIGLGVYTVNYVKN